MLSSMALVCRFKSTNRSQPSAQHAFHICSRASGIFDAGIEEFPGSYDECLSRQGNQWVAPFCLFACSENDLIYAADLIGQRLWTAWRSLRGLWPPSRRSPSRSFSTLRWLDRLDRRQNSRVCDPMSCIACTMIRAQREAPSVTAKCISSGVTWPGGLQNRMAK